MRFIELNDEVSLAFLSARVKRELSMLDRERANLPLVEARSARVKVKKLRSLCLVCREKEGVAFG